MKEPVEAAAATVRLPGTVRLALLLVRATEAPPVGAGPLKVTVQALVPAPVREVGVQVRLLTVTPGAAAVTMPPVAEAASAVASGEAAETFVI